MQNDGVSTVSCFSCTGLNYVVLFQGPLQVRAVQLDSSGWRQRPQEGYTPCSVIGCDVLYFMPLCNLGPCCSLIAASSRDQNSCLKPVLKHNTSPAKYMGLHSRELLHRGHVRNCSPVIFNTESTSGTDPALVWPTSGPHPVIYFSSLS